MEKTQKIKNSIDKSNIMLANIQLLITLITVIFGICYLYNSNFNIYFKISLILNLIIMAYNNQKIYNRLPMTIVYLLVAIILLIFTILMVI